MTEYTAHYHDATQPDPRKAEPERGQTNEN